MVFHVLGWWLSKKWSTVSNALTTHICDSTTSTWSSSPLTLDWNPTSSTLTEAWCDTNSWKSSHESLFTNFTDPKWWPQVVKPCVSSSTKTVSATWASPTHMCSDKASYGMKNVTSCSNDTCPWSRSCISCSRVRMIYLVRQRRCALRSSLIYGNRLAWRQIISEHVRLITPLFIVNRLKWLSLTRWSTCRWR